MQHASTESVIEDSSIDTDHFASMPTEEDKIIEPINAFMYINEINWKII